MSKPSPVLPEQRNRRAREGGRETQTRFQRHDAKLLFQLALNVRRICSMHGQKPPTHRIFHPGSRSASPQREMHTFDAVLLCGPGSWFPNTTYRPTRSNHHTRQIDRRRPDHRVRGVGRQPLPNRLEHQEIRQQHPAATAPPKLKWPARSSRRTASCTGWPS